MKTVIIPDIHTHFEKAEEIIDKESPDNVVFLGDYFDDFGDSLETTEQVARWLKGSLEDRTRIHLLGNHDLSYLDRNYPCSGFTENKYSLIKSIVDLSKLKTYCFVENYLCTHAGLSKDFFEAYVKVESIVDFLDRNSVHLFDCSSLRGGINPYSGIVWCDYTEFKDIPGVKQIFGHTKGYEVRQTENHVCLDTGLDHYAIHDDVLKIISVDD